jgi:fatty-acyl-CoA synthase
MHGAAQWSVMTALTTGQTIVFSATPSRFDADEVVQTIEREKVLAVQVVGDAMARPLADAIEHHSADLSSMAVVANGGALLTPTAKQRLIDVKPGPDRHGRRRVVGNRDPDESYVRFRRRCRRGTFNGGPDTSVAAEDLDSILEPGHDGIGWLAQRGFVPLGYKGDAAKTAKTFRSSTVCGTRSLATVPDTSPRAASNSSAATR